MFEQYHRSPNTTAAMRLALTPCGYVEVDFCFLAGEDKRGSFLVVVEDVVVDG